MLEISLDLSDISAVGLFLLIIAAILLIGTLAEELFVRTNIPDVVWLILLGIGLGPFAGISARVEIGTAIPFFAALALIVILTDGASRIRLSELTRSAPRAMLLAIVSFSLSALVVTLAASAGSYVGVLPESWTLLHGVLLGVIVGGPSSLVIMPAMAQAKVAPGLANLLNLESTLTDVLCIVGAATMIDLMLAGDVEPGNPLVAVGRSLGIGMGIGLVFSVLFCSISVFIASDRRRYPVTLSLYIIAFVVIEQVGGSGAIGVFVFALVLAPLRAALIRRFRRERIDQRQSEGGFQNQIAFIVKSFFFALIGFMLAPPWPLILFGVALGVVLLVARGPAVYLATLFSTIKGKRRTLAVVTLPRGMAAGALATLPMAAGVPGTEGLQVIVFACIAATIFLFAVGFPIAKAGMDTVSAEVEDGGEGDVEGETPPVELDDSTQAGQDLTGEGEGSLGEM